MSNTGYCEPGETVIWDLGTIAPGEGITVDMAPKVASVADGTSIQFETELWVGGFQKSTKTKSIVVQSQPFFELTVNDQLAPVNTEGNTEIVLKYSNIETATSNTELTFPIPEGTTYVSSTGSPVFSNGILTWDLGTLQKGQSGEQRVVISTDGAAGTLIEAEPITIKGTDQYSILHEIQVSTAGWLENVNVPDLAPGLALAFNPDPVRPGEKIHIEAVVSNPNSDSVTFSTVQLRMRYPDHLNNFVPGRINTGGASNSATCPNTVSNTGYCEPAEIVVWNLGDIVPGKGITVDMAPTVASVPDGTIIQFETELWVDGIQQITETRSVVVQSQPFFELTVNDQLAPTNTEGNTEIVLKYSNIETASSNTELTFPIPAGTTYVSSTGSPAFSNGILNWDLGTLQNGQSGEQRIVLSTDGTAGTLIETEPITIKGTDQYSILHEVQVSTAGWLENLNTQNLAPELALAFNPDPVRPGTKIHVEAVVSNPNPLSDSDSEVFSNVQLRIRFPDHLNRFVPGRINTGGASNSATCPNTVSNTGYCEPAEIVVWNLGDIVPGKGITVDMAPTVASVVDGTIIQFETELWVDGIQQITETRSVVVQSQPFFELTVNDQLAPTDTEGNTEIVLKYSNIDTAISDTELTFPIPAETTYVSSTGSPALSNGILTWDLGTLQNGQSGEQRIIISTDGTAGTLIGTEPITITGIDQYSIYHEVQVSTAGWLENVRSPKFAPELALAFSPDPVRPGNKIHIEAVVSNSGTESLSNVQLRLRYPDRLNNFIPGRINTGGGTNTVTCPNTVSNTGYCEPAEIVVWNLGTIVPGRGVNVDMAPTIASVDDGKIIQFQAELWVDSFQQITTTKSVVVQADPLFGIAVDETNSPYNSTNFTEFTINYSNIGGMSSDNTELVFPLPEGTNFAKSTDDGVHTEGKVTWDLGRLSTDHSGQVKVLAHLNSDKGNVVANEPISITGVGQDYVTHTVQSGMTGYINTDEQPALTISFDQNPVLPNGQINVSLLLSNTSSNNLYDIQILLRYPDNLNALLPASISTAGSVNTVSCPNTVSNTGYCEPQEMIVWEIGTVLAGSSVEVALQPTVAIGTSYGTMIPFKAEVRKGDEQVTITKETVFVGSDFSSAGSYSTILCGDVNSDSSIDLTDLVLILQTMSGEDVSLSFFRDCNEDGQVDLTDALEILQQLQ